MKKRFFVLMGLLSPVVALAQLPTGGSPTQCPPSGQITTIQGVICKLNEILGALIPFLIALGVVFFIWGVITYVVSTDDEKKKKGRDKMIYGIIGLAVIIALWGLVKIVTNTFVGSNPNIQNINYPTVPF